MRTAVFSDIHSNLEALRAVQQAGRERGVDRWICLGDVVGYGADPAACLALTLEIAAVLVQGNHDAAVAGSLDDEYFNHYARQVVEWTRQALDTTQLEVLRRLDLRHVEVGAHFVHAEPGTPTAWRYVCNAADAVEALGACTQRCLFVGHSHEAFVCAETASGGGTILSVEGHVQLAANTRYLVNAGSVGQPRDGDPRACFALYDDGADTIELVRVAYDIDAAAARIRDVGLPGFLALRLAQGC